MWWLAGVLPGAVAGWAAWRLAGAVLATREEGIPPLPAWSLPLSVLAGAGICAATIGVIGGTWVVVAYLWFAVATLALLITDLRAQLIPDRINGPASAVAAALLVGGALIDGDAGDLARAAAGAAIYFGLLFAVYLVGRGGFGGGDVKLAPLLGAFTAYLGWAHLLAAVVLGFLIGGVVAIVLVVARLRTLRDQFAFGPVLVVGAYIAIARGREIVDWYLR